jgi:hypothetical protein
LQALVSAGHDVCVPPGDWGFDSSIRAGSTPFKLHCLPGAVLHFDKNDQYVEDSAANPDFLGNKLLSWQNATGGGVDGCVTLGTNTGIYWADSRNDCDAGFGKDPPDTNHFFSVFSSKGMTFQNMVDIGLWADSDITLSVSSDADTGSDDNVVKNLFAKNGWAYGPAIIAGHGNTLSGIVTRNIGIDIEPNNDIEAGKTSGNTVTGNFAINDGTFLHTSCARVFWSAGGSAACVGNSTCADGQTVTNNQFEGNMSVFPTCVSGSIKGTWSGNTIVASSSLGTPVCGCASPCF